jgi:heterodisulfide reductase subunit B
MVNKIVQGAMDVKADCIVTSCAMCHMNLEARSTIKEKLPIFHFSELLSLALDIGECDHKKWFSRHLINPIPLLKAKAIDIL